MGRLQGKVAFVTGAGRGQGRSHALRLAQEGADLIIVDICEDVPAIPGALATEDDLTETARAIEALDRRVVAAKADVRDLERLREVVDDGVALLGGLDVVVANAGVCTMQPWDAVTPDIWHATIDVNLAGVWHTCAATAPHLIERGGGAMILTSSTSGIIGTPFLLPYTAAKHGVVGIMKVLANELGIHHIRVNTVHPGSVDTAMLANVSGQVAPLLEQRPDLMSMFTSALPVEKFGAQEISNAVAFLASDEGRYVTGLEMVVDAGFVGH
jgi:SDR family mycofactocin-dependent oxidoreductase